MRKKAALLLIAGWFTFSLRAEESRPNILLIITDQQNNTAMSVAGNPFLKTPVIDSLAARGVRFTKSYCTYPLCSPSRASQFTSLMPHEVGINSNRKPNLSPEVTGMGNLFRKAGYETAWSGKWHLPALFPALAQKGANMIPGFEVLPMRPSKQLPKNGGDDGKGMIADPAATDAAVRFLRSNHAKPFLLVVSLLDPHDIVGYKDNPDPFRSLVESMPPPPVPENWNAVNDVPDVVKAYMVDGWSEKEWRLYRSAYYRLCEYSDAHIGQILAALKSAKLDKNTVVIFTSDHGESMGAHHLVHKESMYEESAGVPFIVAPPAGAVKGVNTSNLVSGLDLLPTMLDYAGISIPASLRGESVRPLVEGRAVPWRSYVVSELADNRDSRMVRTARYKYVVYADGGNREQLFDMESDPGETKNLVRDEKSASVLAQHREMLAEWLKETKDPFIQTGKPVKKPREGGAAKAKKAF